MPWQANTTDQEGIIRCRSPKQFDGGNIVALAGSNADEICLEIRSDQSSEFYQWFYFRLSGAKDSRCQIRILNAAGAAYPDGFWIIASATLMIAKTGCATTLI